MERKQISLLLMIANIKSEIGNRGPPGTNIEFSNSGLGRVEHGRTGGFVGRYAVTMFSTLQQRPAIKTSCTGSSKKMDGT